MPHGTHIGMIITPTATSDAMNMAIFWTKLKTAA